LLYYGRDYEGSLKVGERILEVARDEETRMGSSDRVEIETLVERCRRRLNIPSAVRQ